MCGRDGGVVKARASDTIVGGCSNPATATGLDISTHAGSTNAAPGNAGTASIIM